MKVTYRQATEMTGFPGAVVRGRIWDRLIREFYGQPDVKAGTIKSVLLGIVYGLTVAVLTLALSLGSAEFPFFFIGMVVALYLAAYSAPTKGFHVFMSERMDKEFDL